MLGHSWGGYVALAYALSHPDQVERVVVVSSVSPKISATEFLAGALFPERIAAQKGLSADNPDDVQTYMRGQLAMSFYSSEVRDRVLTGLGLVAYNGRQETLLWKDAEAHDLTGDLNRLSMPVLVTTGRFDVNVAPRTAWRIHQAIPGSQFAVWERSGHFPMIEEPYAFFAEKGPDTVFKTNPRVAKFLRNVGTMADFPVPSCLLHRRDESKSSDRAPEMRGLEAAAQEGQPSAVQASFQKGARDSGWKTQG